jgi:hypothetical protein
MYGLGEPREEPAEWGIVDVAALVLEHFGLAAR